MESLKDLIKSAHEGDRQARNRLVTDNTGLIWNVVKHYLGRGYDAQELFQTGCIGLIKAIDRFDLTMGVCFSTYAVPMIAGEIRRFMRDDGMIKVSRTMKETAIKARQLESSIQAKYGRDPSSQELAAMLGISSEELAAALASSQEVESLQKVIYQSDGNDILLMDRLEADDREQEQLINRIALKKVMHQLENREQKIIALRYYYGQTQMQTAASLGITQVQVSRIEKKVLKKMKMLLEN